MQERAGIFLRGERVSKGTSYRGTCSANEIKIRSFTCPKLHFLPLKAVVSGTACTDMEYRRLFCKYGIVKQEGKMWQLGVVILETTSFLTVA